MTRAARENATAHTMAKMIGARWSDYYDCAEVPINLDFPSRPVTCESIGTPADSAGFPIAISFAGILSERVRWRHTNKTLIEMLQLARDQSISWVFGVVGPRSVNSTLLIGIPRNYNTTLKRAPLLQFSWAAQFVLG